MLLYIRLYIVLAYLKLFAALTNAVCLNNASFLSLICANAFYFHALSLFISFFYLFFICIMHSAINLLVFPNYMHTLLLLLFFYIFFMKGL